MGVRSTGQRGAPGHDHLALAVGDLDAPILHARLRRSFDGLGELVLREGLRAARHSQERSPSGRSAGQATARSWFRKFENRGPDETGKGFRNYPLATRKVGHDQWREPFVRQ
jgi:hypothetical protein